MKPRLICWTTIIVIVLSFGVSMFTIGRYVGEQSVEQPDIFTSWYVYDEMNYTEFYDIWYKYTDRIAPTVFYLRPPKPMPCFELAAPLFVTYDLRGMNDIWCIKVRCVMGIDNLREWDLRVEVRTGYDSEHIKFALIMDASPSHSRQSNTWNDVTYIDIMPSSRHYPVVTGRLEVHVLLFGFGTYINTMNVHAMGIDSGW